MEIKIINNASNIKIITEKDSKNLCTIRIENNENNLKPLKEMHCGDIVTIGKYSYIVLDQSTETTAILFFDSLDKKMFDNNNGDYKASDIRKYLNDKYYKELCSAVGKDNIIKHKVNLEAGDGTNKDDFCEDFISLITVADYRRYRELIPAAGLAGLPWWTATRTTVANKIYSRCVCYVNPYGILDWGDCGYHYSVRPFIVLKSSTMVQPVSPLKCLNHNEY